jgi:hypothetical protein
MPYRLLGAGPSGEKPVAGLAARERGRPVRGRTPLSAGSWSPSSPDVVDGFNFTDAVLRWRQAAPLRRLAGPAEEKNV